MTTRISKFNIFASLSVMIFPVILILLSVESKVLFGIATFLLFMVVLFCLFRQLKGITEGKGVASSIVLFGILFWLLYPALIYSIFIDPEQYRLILNRNFDSFQVNKSLLLIGIFSFSFLFFSGIDREYSYISENRIYERPKKIPWIAFIFCIIGLLPILASGFSLEAIFEALMFGRNADKPWVHSNNIGNETSGIIYLATCCAWAGVMLLITYAMHSKDAFPKKVFGGTLAFIIFIFLSIDSGTRSLSMLALLPSVCISLILKRANINYAKFIIYVGGIALLIVFLIQFQLFFRQGNFGEGDALEFVVSDLMLLGGSIDYFIETLYSVMLVPNLHSYFFEFDLIYFTTFPIPRFIWPDKPVTDIVWFYTMQRWGYDLYSDVGNIFPGLVGQYYMSFGVGGPALIGGVFAYICGVIDRRIYVAKLSDALFSLSVYLMYAVWLFVSFRYFSPGFLFPVLIAHLILVISRRKFKDVKRAV